MKLAYPILFIYTLICRYKKTYASDYPTCTGCVLYASGTDGNLWGWENFDFCKIPSSCQNNLSDNTNNNDKDTSNPQNNSNNNNSNSSNTNTNTNNNNNNNLETSDNSKTSPEEIIANNNNNNINGGISMCSSCDVVATGGDGVLYGFENGSSCQIDEKKCKKESSKTTTTESSKTTTTDATVSATSDTSNTKEERDKEGILICNHCNPDSTADDKTLWGHQNGEACRVIGSRCHINISEHPFCKGCVVTATGTDSSLWGWENNSSCMIDEKSCGILSGINSNENSGSLSIIANLYIGFIAIVTLLIIYSY